MQKNQITVLLHKPSHYPAIYRNLNVSSAKIGSINLEDRAILADE
jgi:hypothetical protein